MQDLIDFGDCASADAEPIKSKVSDFDLSRFDPLLASSQAPEAPICGLSVPAAVAAAFNAGAPVAASRTSSSPEERFVGTWRFKRDTGCTYRDFDSECHIEAGQVGLLLREPQPDGTEATGLMQPTPDGWFQVELTARAVSGKETHCGSVRLRWSDKSSDSLTRCFRESGQTSWQETRAERGLSPSEQAALLKLGVAEAAGRYREQQAAEDAAAFGGQGGA